MDPGRKVTLFAPGPRVTVFDGAIGTQLLLRGADLHLSGDVRDSDDDYWTGRAVLSSLAILQSVHRDYLLAGADFITTNTFRTNVRAVAGTDIDITSTELTRLTVEAARAARDAIDATRKVAGSIGPVDACYDPSRAPADDILHAEHASMLAAMALGKVDLALIETMNSIREARIAASEAARAQLPFAVSFVLREDGITLLSGESLRAAVEAVLPFSPSALLANCVPPRAVPHALKVLGETLRGTGIPFGAQPNLDKPTHEGGLPGNLSPEGFATLNASWIDLGATILGGCCGTSPTYTAALKGASVRSAAAK